MTTILALLTALITGIAILLLSIAALLVFAPELLLGPLQPWFVAACIVAGLCMLTPVAIIIISAINSKRPRKK